MAMRVYATAADYYDFVGEDQPMTTPEGESPAVPVVEKDLNALLRRASIRVDTDTKTSVFDADTDGYPTEADVIEAFKNATCAYVAWFLDTDDITGAGSQEGTVKIGSVQLGGGNAGTAAGQRTADDVRRCPEADDILANAGLLSTATAHN